MLFNSIDFLFFLLVVAGCYCFLRQRVLARNVFLLIGSYTFYGWWDARFLSLLLFSTVVDYWVARAIASRGQQGERRWLLLLSVLSNLGILGYFKYADFFIHSTTRVLEALGFQGDFATLEIILPVGISFYTFQTLSYTVDVYRGKLTATRSFLDFALYVAFFPQLVAGPIERAGRLLPQLAAPVRYRPVDFSAGFWLIVFGYFKKVFVADNLGASIDPIFANPESYSATEIWLSVLGFSAQIYGDFSGYSDIARGVSRLLGFQLMVNFRLPYFARSPSDFWSRWHISLSTWLRDYLYIPLGGNRGGKLKTARNLMLTMLLGGLWHGASMKFIAWGGFHGALLVMQKVFQNRFGDDETGDMNAGEADVSKFMAFLQIVAMFGLTQVGWMVFRAPSLSSAWMMCCNTDWSWASSCTRLAAKILFYAGPLAIIDTWMHVSGDLLAPLKLPLMARCVFYGLLLLTVILMGFDGSSDFIYFQF